MHLRPPALVAAALLLTACPDSDDGTATDSSTTGAPTETTSTDAGTTEPTTECTAGPMVSYLCRGAPCTCAIDSPEPSKTCPAGDVCGGTSEDIRAAAGACCGLSWPLSGTG